MLGLFFKVLLAVCCLLMFIVKREYKISILLFAFAVLPEVTLPSPLGGTYFILPIVYVLSESPYVIKYISTVKNSSIWWFLGIVLASTVFFVALSHNYTGSLKSIISVLVSEYFSKYLILLLAFVAASKEKSLPPLVKAAFFALICLTVAGVINYFARSAFFLEDITGGRLHNGVAVGQYYSEMTRFRVQSLFVNPFSYGYMCIVLLLVLLYGYQNGVVTKNRLIAGLLMTLFGIVTCSCRTVLFCFIFSALIYYIFRYSGFKSIIFILLAFLFLFIAYAEIGVVRNIIDFMLSVFDDNSELGGSSIELRVTQFMRVLYYIKDDWFLGRGLGFLWYDLGLNEGSMNMVDKDIKGLESVFYLYLLERGVLGYIIYLIQYIILISYVLKHYRDCKDEVAWCATVMTAYLVFAYMTGEQLSVPPTMILLGFSLRMIQDQTYNIDIERRRQRFSRYRYRQLSMR